MGPGRVQVASGCVWCRWLVSPGSRLDLFSEKSQLSDYDHFKGDTATGIEPPVLTLIGPPVGTGLGFEFGAPTLDAALGPAEATFGTGLNLLHSRLFSSASIFNWFIDSWAWEDSTCNEHLQMQRLTVHFPLRLTALALTGCTFEMRLCKQVARCFLRSAAFVVISSLMFLIWTLHFWKSVRFLGCGWAALAAALNLLHSEDLSINLLKQSAADRQIFVGSCSNTTTSRQIKYL
uniref:Uncharacterized protein n=1 Tax=Romanomermis culicivorax TaxID=13658 RepID=A0A915KUY3_ROMCU